MYVVLSWVGFDWKVWVDGWVCFCLKEIEENGRVGG